MIQMYVQKTGNHLQMSTETQFKEGRSRPRTLRSANCTPRSAGPQVAAPHGVGIGDGQGCMKLPRLGRMLSTRRWCNDRSIYRDFHARQRLEAQGQG